MIPAMGRSSLSLSAIEKRLRSQAGSSLSAPDAASGAEEGRVGKAIGQRASRASARAATTGKGQAGGGAPVRVAGQVRIVGGAWRRRLLPVASGPGVPAGLRPTPDRVRETLFNWLGQDLGGWRCFDAFAGTGALGFEAASRGAAQVRMVEQDAGLAQQLERLTQHLKAEGVHVQRGDGIAALTQGAANYWHAVFIDPPFTMEALFAPAVKAAAHAVADDGFVYLEAPKAWTDAELAEFGLQQYRYLKAGNVHAHLLKKIGT